MVELDVHITCMWAASVIVVALNAWLTNGSPAISHSPRIFFVASRPPS
jgi:hypothetical protein